MVSQHTKFITLTLSSSLDLLGAMMLDPTIKAATKLRMSAQNLRDYLVAEPVNRLEMTQ